MARLRKSLLVLVFVMKYWGGPGPRIRILPFHFLSRSCKERAILSFANRALARWNRSILLQQCPVTDVGVGISTLDSHLKQPICLEFASGRVDTTQARPGALCDERYRPDHRAEKRPAVSPRHPVTGCEGMASIPAASSIRRKTAEKSFSLLPDNSSEFT
jgi:hypothetical protein